MFSDLKNKYGYLKFYALVFAALAFAFYAGLRFSEFQYTRLEQRIELLSNSMQSLHRENNEIAAQLNVKQVELEIASITNEQLRQSMQESVTTENELRQQISFYQKVMAPEMSQDGFFIENIEINATPSENNFAMNMMLLQHQNIKSTITGTLRINLVGSEKGKPRTVSLNSLFDNDQQQLRFSFKYFQIISTRFSLPADFVPEKITISTDVYKFKRKRGSYQRTFPWQVESFDNT